MQREVLGRLKLLLDTTYILPVLGVEVEGVERVLEALQRLRRHRRVEVYYSCYSILEALWKLAKLSYDLEVVRRGLSLVEEDFKQARPTLEGYLKALELKRSGLPDIIDLLLYTTALSNGILLTRDKHLHSSLSEEGEETSAILLEEDFLREHAQQCLSGSTWQCRRVYGALYSAGSTQWDDQIFSTSRAGMLAL